MRKEIVNIKCDIVFNTCDILNGSFREDDRGFFSWKCLGQNLSDEYFINGKARFLKKQRYHQREWAVLKLFRKRQLFRARKIITKIGNDDGTWISIVHRNSIAVGLHETLCDAGEHDVRFAETLVEKLYP